LTWNRLCMASRDVVWPSRALIVCCQATAIRFLRQPKKAMELVWKFLREFAANASPPTIVWHRLERNGQFSKAFQQDKA